MKKKFKVIAVVAARGGSKGIKNKNLRLIKGKPLVYYCIQNLIKSNSIDKICLSTDSKKIETTVKKYFPHILFDKRPKKYSTDKTPLISVPMYVCKKLNKKGVFYDFVLQVAPTCPFVKPKTISKIVKLLKSKKSDCVVTLKKIEHEHPYRAKVLNKKNFTFKPLIRNINVEKFISRQDLPELFCTSGAIYGRSNKLICSYNEKDFCFGKNPIGVPVDDIESINIDRMVDFYFANYIASENKLI